SREGALAFKAAFDHLVDQFPGATVTSDPAEPEPGGIHARKLYTLSYPDDAPLRFVFRLYRPDGAAWWLEAIIPLDSRSPDAPPHDSG
ncbi:MAG TPA: hypothetical protein VFF69_01380, partial [Phycisphaerales bacterium]|nr:hypothetical protein [Phycisphaerales bacterium]